MPVTRAANDRLWREGFATPGPKLLLVPEQAKA